MTATDAADLVDKYTPLALSIARKRGARFNWLLDDLISDATYALWRAALSWDPERSKFPVWARGKIRWAIARRIQTERSRNPAAFMSCVMTSPDGETVNMVEMAPAGERSAEDAAELADDMAQLPELLATLNPSRRRIIEQRFLEEVGTAEIAAAEGVTQKRIYQQVERSLELMKSAARK